MLAAMVVTLPVIVFGLLGASCVGAVVVAILESTLGSARSAPEGRQRAELWSRAPHERAAAKELRQRLQHDLRMQEQVRKDLAREDVTDPRHAAMMRDLDRAEQATRDEIARVEVWLR